MRPCKICQSPNKSIYEDLIKIGVPLRKIVEKAKEEFNEGFSHMALSRHYKNHMDYNPTREISLLPVKSSTWEFKVHRAERKLECAPFSLERVTMDHPSFSQEENSVIDRWHLMLRLAAQKKNESQKRTLVIGLI